MTDTVSTDSTSSAPINPLLSSGDQKIVPGQTETPPAEGTQPGTETPKPEQVEEKRSRIEKLAEFNRRAALEREKRSLEEKLKQRENDPGYQKYKSLKENPDADPFEVLKEFGLDYDKLTERMIAKKPEQKSELQELQETVKSLREEIENSKKESVSKEQQQAINSYKHGLKSHIKGNENFELMEAMGDKAIETAYETMLDFYKQTGEVLTNDELCEHVEKSMLQEIETEIDRLSKLKKLANKFGKQSEPPAQAGQANEQKPGVSVTQPTLTNNMVTRTIPDSQHISDDRLALAEAAKLLRLKS